MALLFRYLQVRDPSMYYGMDRGGRPYKFWNGEKLVVLWTIAFIYIRNFSYVTGFRVQKHVGIVVSPD